MVRIAALLAVIAFPGAVGAVCPGDCDRLGSVEISELIRGVNIALENTPVTQCPEFDTNAGGTVTVNELVAAVLAALNGCPVEPTPTPTVSIEPIFPADYRDTFVEVRDCRFSIEHRGVMIRVFANSIGAEPYRRLENPLPVGSIIVKEEFEGLACDDADLAHWSVMRKETPGFDPEDADWRWQQVEAPSRSVLCDDKNCPSLSFPCVGCHRQPDCLARDYMCTEDDTPRGTLGKVLEGLPAAVLSIAGRSPTDVYAVGADPSGDDRGPLVLHYNGTNWRRLDSGATGDLWWISVTPIDGDFYMAGANGLILQFDPTSGEFTRHSNVPDTTSTLFGIWGTAADNLFAVGGDDESQAVIWRFEGATWTAQDVSAVVPQGVPTTLNKIWGRSADDVYAVGETGVVLRFNGTAWSLVASGVDRPLFTLHGNASLLNAVGGFVLDGEILERTDNAFARRAPSGTPRMNGVFVPSNGESVAVGINLSVAARSSSGWTLVDEGADQQLRDFHAVWIDAEDGIWAVGGDLSFLSNGVIAYGGPQDVAGGPVE